MLVGLVSVWRTTTQTRLAEWPLSCKGITSLLKVRGGACLRYDFSPRVAIWAGSKTGTIFIWDALTHEPLLELSSHSDSVRCLLAMDRHVVVSGAAEKDGTLVVWNTIAPGRHTTQMKTASLHSRFALPNSGLPAVYDRYGFLQAPAGGAADGQYDDLATSLPGIAHHYLTALFVWFY